MRHAFIFVLVFLTGLLSGQQLSNTVYPTARCLGSNPSCPLVTTVKTFVTASYFDSIAEVLYIAGAFDSIGPYNRTGLAAINMRTGQALNWGPIVSGGSVFSITKFGDTLYLGGTFSQINSTSRNKLAAVSASTGTLIASFNPAAINSTIDTISALLVRNGFLYVGGRFTQIAGNAKINVARLNLNGTVDAGFTIANCPAVYKMKHAPTSSNLFILGYNVSESSIALYRASTALSGGPANLWLKPASFELILDFVFRGTSIFFVGNFTSLEDNATNIYSREYIASCTTGSPVINAAWNPSIAIYSVGEYRDRLFIAYQRDSIYIGMVQRNATSNINFLAHQRIYAVHYSNASSVRLLKTYAYNSSVEGNFCDGLLSGVGRMIEVEKYAQFNGLPNGGVSDDQFYSWCFTPPAQPANFTSSTTTLCAGDSNVLFGLPTENIFTSYMWTYSGTGATITPLGNGNSVSIDFSTVATSGVLQVRGFTSCGIPSANTRSISITVNPIPQLTGVADTSITCYAYQITLDASTSTNATTLVWQYPNMNIGTDPILANEAGMYRVTATTLAGCLRSDTTWVVADTLAPTIQPFGLVPTLTCLQSAITLDAALLYPNDSLHWNGANLPVNASNPVTVSQSGNYLLQVLNVNNGCSDTSLVFVAQNINPPIVNASIPDTLLTCFNTSILLGASSLNSNVIFEWLDSANTSYASPFLVNSVGAYTLIGTDTTNGCSSLPNTVIIYANQTRPNLQLPIGPFDLNCSQDTLLLDGSSGTPNTFVYWLGPTSNLISDPAMATLSGTYTFIVQDQNNGCIKQDSVLVTFSNRLLLNPANDTSICLGSGAVLLASPIGGTAPFNFAWNNNVGNTSPVTVFPTDSLAYIVTVTDQANCIGTDTVWVNVPDPIGDSTLTFQPCDPNNATGSVQVYAFGGVPPYQFSIDNGLTWQPIGVFNNLNYGTYSILILDTLGCTRSDTAIIDTTSLSPSPEFLVSTSPQLGDTLVFVDISNPRPDSVFWFFPLGTTLVDSSMFAPIVVPSDTGDFLVTMRAYYGTCELNLTRLIQVGEFDSTFASPYNNNGIDTIILYPNPNTGTFNLEVHLFKKQSFVIFVTDASGIERTRIPVSDADFWTGSVSVPNPVAGNYILRVVAEYDAKQVIFVITQ
jgi:hypothetical protein